MSLRWYGPDEHVFHRALSIVIYCCQGPVHSDNSVSLYFETLTGI
jgi:hypothetical protein